MIEFTNVCASYDSKTSVLNDVSFTISSGEFVAFVGSNGAGKSTTMRLINGLLKPRKGQVLIDGVCTSQIRTSEMASHVGFLFQNPDRQICCNTVREELMFGFSATGRVDEHAKARVDEVMSEFGFAPDADPFMLNRGARQLLALASIIVMEPSVVILDEPTVGLDGLGIKKVMERIKRLNEAGTTIIMVCHDMEIVADYARRVIVMSSGRVIDDGATFDILRQPSTIETADLIPSQIIALSMQLASKSAELSQTNIARAHTLEEMRDAVSEQLARQGGSK